MKKDMKKMLVIAAMALCVAACSLGQKPDQYKDAVKEEIVRLVGADAKVSFNTFELKETTTYADELEYRKGLITARQAMNKMLKEKYENEKMSTNAHRKLTAMLNDEEVLKGLETIRERMAAADSLDKVAYYVFQFTGEARCEGATTSFKDYFACVTPTGEVLSVTDNEKAIHKGLGKIIEGYRTILKSSSEEETE